MPAEERGPIISAIIVSWNTRDLLRACLQAVLAGPDGAGPDGIEVIVVDNASTDGTPEMVRREFPQVNLVANPDNRGYTGGNNQGFRLARGEYILVLNSDTVPQPGAIRAMSDFLYQHPQAAMVGPRLLWPDGSTQSSRRRFPTMATGLLESTLVQRLWQDNSVIRHYYCHDLPDDTAQPVDWVVGACVMMRKVAIEQVGGFDEDYFMYSEEVDWCFRAKAAGWDVWYTPVAEVTHHHGKSSEQDPLARERRFQDSKIRFLAKHRGRGQAVLVRLFLILTYIVAWIGFSLAVLFSSYNRRDRQVWRKALAGSFRWQISRLVGRAPGPVR
jgi:N-acetylglucosaminyl-diphospho-decaprenol L-rhamnosyltransferase